MIENDKLQQLRDLAKEGLDELDTSVARICRRQRTKNTPSLVADALLDGLTAALEIYFSEPNEPGFAFSTQEFRILVRAALTPDIRRRIIAYTEQ